MEYCIEEMIEFASSLLLVLSALQRSINPVTHSLDSSDKDSQIDLS